MPPALGNLPGILAGIGAWVTQTGPAFEIARQCVFQSHLADYIWIGFAFTFFLARCNLLFSFICT